MKLRNSLSFKVGVATVLTTPVLTVVSCGVNNGDQFDFSNDLLKISDQVSSFNKYDLWNNVGEKAVGDTISANDLGISFDFSVGVTETITILNTYDRSDKISIGITLYKGNQTSGIKEIIVSAKPYPVVTWDANKTIAGQEIFIIDGRQAAVSFDKDEVDAPLNKEAMEAAIKNALPNIGDISLEMNWINNDKFDGEYQLAIGQYQARFNVYETEFIFNVDVTDEVRWDDTAKVSGVDIEVNGNEAIANFYLDQAPEKAIIEQQIKDALINGVGSFAWSTDQEYRKRAGDYQATITIDTLKTKQEIFTFKIHIIQGATWKYRAQIHNSFIYINDENNREASVSFQWDHEIPNLEQIQQEIELAFTGSGVFAWAKGKTYQQKFGSYEATITIIEGGQTKVFTIKVRIEGEPGWKRGQKVAYSELHYDSENHFGKINFATDNPTSKNSIEKQIKLAFIGDLNPNLTWVANQEFPNSQVDIKKGDTYLAQIPFEEIIYHFEINVVYPPSWQRGSIVNREKISINGNHASINTKFSYDINTAQQMKGSINWALDRDSEWKSIFEWTPGKEYKQEIGIYEATITVGEGDWLKVFTFTINIDDTARWRQGAEVAFNIINASTYEASISKVRRISWPKSKELFESQIKNAFWGTLNPVLSWVPGKEFPEDRRDIEYDTMYQAIIKFQGETFTFTMTTESYY